MQKLLKRKRKKNVVQPLTELPHQNNRTLLAEARFAGKSYLMLKVLSRMSGKDIYIVTKSAPEQKSNSKTKLNEIGEEIKHFN